MLAESTSLTVYDCNHDKVTYQAIDLLEPQPCDDPDTDFMDPTERRVQILNTEKDRRIIAYACQVFVTKEIHFCGFDSISYGSKITENETPVDITPSVCREAVKGGKMHLTEWGKTYELGPTQTHFDHFYSHGSLDNKGHCERETFTSGGIAYTGASESIFINIRLKKIRGILDVSTGLVQFSTGISVPYKDGVLRDQTEGTMVWDLEPPKCDSTLGELYQGKGLLHQKKTGLLGSILLIKDNQTGQYTGLTLQMPTSICGMECRGTQIPGVVACLLREYDSPLPLVEPKFPFNSLVMDVLSQVSYLHLSTNLKMHQNFRELYQQTCLLDREQLVLKLQILADEGSPYMLTDLFPPGHRTYRAGTVVYIAKCVPLQAKRISYPNCTQEIPVEVDGVRRFADPYNWVLQDHPNEAPCSDLTPIRWKLEGQWYCSTPTIRPCDAPDKLQLPPQYPALVPTEFTRGLGTGLFTKIQLQQHAEFVLAYMARAPTLAKLVSSATRQMLGGSTLGSPIGITDLEELTDRLSYHLLPLFYLLGNLYHYVVAIMIFWVIIKIVTGSSVRAYILWIEKGGGWWILAACWRTAYEVVRSPITLLETTTTTVTEPVNQYPCVEQYYPLEEGTPDQAYRVSVIHTTIRRNQRQLAVLENLFPRHTPIMKRQLYEDKGAGEDRDRDSKEESP